MIFGKNFGAILFFLLLILLPFLAVLGSGIDTSFNANIETDRYRGKEVKFLDYLPDGRIIAAGKFTKYNNQSVGAIIRLNPDGSLDTSFVDGTISPGDFNATHLEVATDGRIMLAGRFTLSDGTTIVDSVLILLPNGELDPSFQLAVTGYVRGVAFAADGKIYLSGSLQYASGSSIVSRSIVRLNMDGSVDSTFDAPQVSDPYRIQPQGNKLIYSETAQNFVHRLLESGEADPSFTVSSIGALTITDSVVQTDGKVLFLFERRMARIGETGGIDPAFSTPIFESTARKILSMADGRFVVANEATQWSGGLKIRRYLPSGAQDPTFPTFTNLNVQFQGSAIDVDGNVLVGDRSLSTPVNNFFRILNTGVQDGTFNTGGTGFQNLVPGRVGTVKVLQGEKLLIAGDFDRVGGTPRAKVARLNSDGTIDTSFSIVTLGSGNRFTLMQEVYEVAVQNDGKFVLSGEFTYLVQGLTKRNIVRLNSDGSIDPSFELGAQIENWFAVNLLSRNKPIAVSGGGILIGTSRSSGSDQTKIPLMLNANGSVSGNFNPHYLPSGTIGGAFDVDEVGSNSYLVGGRRSIKNVSGWTTNSFIIRIDSSGNLDKTFVAPEFADQEVSSFYVLDDGHILVAIRSINSSKILRLEPDGTVDQSFNVGTIANGRVNDILALDDGRIIVGGSFTIFAGEPRQNVAVLNPDGTLSTALIAANGEVWCITTDASGRVLFGGAFSHVQDSKSQYGLSYLARVEFGVQESYHAPFDFDGDGKTDVSVFRPVGGSGSEWWYLRSSDGGNRAFAFGEATDTVVPADFTGDGKTDLAFWRPASGEWFVLRSEDSTFFAFPFGAAGDVPSPADFDGDGRSDATVYRPSTNTWFTLRSSDGQVSATPFGTAGDKPVPADYDGDGKSDVAIFRPTGGSGGGEWWYLRSSDGANRAFAFGSSTDLTVPGDYTGDGKADLAYFRPSTGEWYVLRSEDSSFYAFPWGANGDLPAPGDYDGDGTIDAAVFRPSNSNWFALRSTAGPLILQFGTTGDRPLPNAYVR